MRIAILEWICGGGLLSEQNRHLFSALQPEGWAMLRCLVRELTRAGFDVATVIDDRLTSTIELPPETHVVRAEPDCASRSVPDSWLQLAGSSDYAIVVAPEPNGILEQAILRLGKCTATLVNCAVPFVREAADKLATAQACQRAGLPHPPTSLGSEVTSSWLQRVSVECGCELWVVKPRHGAGAEELRVCDRLQLEALLGRWSHSARQLRQQASALESLATGAGDSAKTDSPLADWIVQPWLPGPSYSRSAIVDQAGTWHWLPLTTQDFAVDVSAGPRQLWYRGGALADASTQNDFPSSLMVELPTAWTGGAAGWIGVDFVFCETDRRWYVIEVNPRCTTSIVGLSQAYRGNLVAELIDSRRPTYSGPSDGWRPMAFTADGHCRPLDE